MTQQNVNAISRHAPDLGRMMKEFGVLAKASTRLQRYVERTGRTTEALKTLDSGLPKIVGVIMNGVHQSGAIAGGFGGGVIGSISGLVAGGALRNTVAKIGATRSGRYAIEKAVQEATKAVRAGASPAAIAAVTPPPTTPATAKTIDRPSNIMPGRKFTGFNIPRRVTPPNKKPSNKLRGKALL